MKYKNIKLVKPELSEMLDNINPSVLDIYNECSVVADISDNNYKWWNISNAFTSIINASVLWEYLKTNYDFSTSSDYTSFLIGISKLLNTDEFNSADSLYGSIYSLSEVYFYSVIPENIKPKKDFISLVWIEWLDDSILERELIVIIFTELTISIFNDSLLFHASIIEIISNSVWEWDSYEETIFRFKSLLENYE